MRLCVLSSSYPRSEADTNNAGVFVRDFALALQSAGKNISGFTHRKGGRSDYRENFPVYEYSWLGRETSLTSVDTRSLSGAIKSLSLLTCGIVSYLRFCRRQKIKYSLAMWAVPSGIFAWLAWKLFRTPYAVWALGSDIWRYQNSRFFGPLLRAVLSGAEVRLADGLELARRVEAICGKGCEFVPSARDLGRYQPTVVEEDRPHPRFLFVGRWELNKGPDVLIEAARQYLDQGGRGSFDLFGEGSLRSMLAGKIEQAGLQKRIRLHGVIGPEELVGRFAWCDVLVIPSRIESIPVIFSDALQCRSPVLATEVGDLGRLVREYEVGVVVPPDDIPALAQALLDWDDLDPKEFAQATDKAKENFSIKRSAERFLELAGLKESS